MRIAGWPSELSFNWIDSAAYYAGYAIAIAFLFLPIVVVVLVMRTRWFKRRKRIRPAGDLPPYGGRPYMDSLPPPFSDWPPDRKRR